MIGRGKGCEEAIGYWIGCYLMVSGIDFIHALRLFSVHAKATEFVQRVIRQRIKGLIKAIGQQSSKLLNIIRNFPPGGDRLVIRILVVLTDTGECLFCVMVLLSCWGKKECLEWKE